MHVLLVGADFEENLGLGMIAAVEGREILWKPTSEADHLRVAARSTGGIAVLGLRANTV